MTRPRAERRSTSAPAAEAGLPEYVLRLYTTGASPRSTRAVRNAKAACEAHLVGRYSLTVIDLYEQPHMASEHQVVAVPTLVRERPEPVRRLIGDLSDLQKLLDLLDATPLAE